MWHHAQFRGEELLVLGHNPRNNDCMLIRLSGLPMNEQSELRKIAASRASQESNYLIPILKKMEAPNGSDWFSYVCKKMEQRNSPVFMLPIKEIQDTLDQDQKAIFKGYGKGRVNRTLEVEDRLHAYSDYEDERHPDREFRPETSDDHVQTSSSIENKIDTLAESTRQTNALLNKLVDVLAAQAKPSAPQAKKTVMKPRKRRTEKPDLSNLGHNGGPPLGIDERV